MNKFIEIRLRKSLPHFAFALFYFFFSLLCGYVLYWYRGQNGLRLGALVRIVVYQLPFLSLMLLKIRLHGVLDRLARPLFFFGGAFICLWLWENVNGESVFRLSLVPFAINYALMLLVFTFFYALFGNVRRSVPLAFCVMTVTGYFYHCVMLFRGTPLLPADFAAFTTALSVAGGYRYPFHPVHFLALSACLSMCVCSRSLEKESPLRQAVITRGFSLASCAVCVCLLLNTPLLERLGVSASMWPEDVPHILHRCGTLAHFSVHLYGLIESPPDHYCPQDIEAQLQAAPPAASLLKEPLETNPNIIVIMNESFADLNDALGVLSDVDPMPFIHSLHKNTISGDLFVSVRGGTTCNTEYEFLTGNVLTPNKSTVAFYQTVTHPMPALPYLLKAQGYATIAMHPASKENYRRAQVYRDLGFDLFMDESAFTNIQTFRNNGYVSDRTCYEEIKTLYRQKDAGERLFIFNVTIQNHSGYTTGGTLPTVSLTSSASQEAELNEYLRCIKESDDAFCELVSFFSAQTEPVLILFFGDHQPWLTYDGKREPRDQSPAKAALCEYVVPFVIWANYDIEEKNVQELSPHYLYSLLLSCTPLQISPYEAYLLSLMEDYPVVTRWGYTDAEGTYTPFGLAGAVPDALRPLYGAVYNRVHDARNRLTLYDLPTVRFTP